MRRLVALIAIIALAAVGLVLVQPAGAKSLAGKKCTKAGQERVHEGTAFVCRKKRGSLVWVTVKSPKPTPTPSPTPTPTPTPTTTLTTAECAQIWYDFQYADVAPGFPTTTRPDLVGALHVECQEFDLLPAHDERIRLTQRAFSTVAQILEKRISEVSTASGKEPCFAISEVLKPVGAYGRPLGPGDDVEGYAADSFLPILKYNWYGGPFRLKYAVGCYGAPHANVWFMSDPYPPGNSHPERYPSDAEAKADPWPRVPVEGPMSTCITWGPGLGNDGIGGRGFILSFDWSRESLPLDVRSCYPRAAGLDGLDIYSYERVPNL
jgi:hypothetical protein